jgi:hypothetical protein
MQRGMADLRSFAHTNAVRGTRERQRNLYPAVAAKFVFVFTPERDTIADMDSSDEKALLLLAVAEDDDHRFIIYWRCVYAVCESLRSYWEYFILFLFVVY